MTVIQFPVVPRRYPPHVSLLDRIRESRAASKASVQSMAESFRVSTWRTEQISNAMVWCDRMMANPNGGRDWVLQALDDLRKYVEQRN